MGVVYGIVAGLYIAGCSLLLAVLYLWLIGEKHEKD